MARCTTRGLREHSLRINSGLGGDMLTRLDKKKGNGQTDGRTDKLPKIRVRENNHCKVF